MREPTRFSAQQVVCLVVAVLAAAVILPAGVTASSGDQVHVTDPETSSRQAQVTSTGELAATLCDPVNAPSTSRCARVIGGKLAVANVPAAPSGSFIETSFLSGSSWVDVTGPHPVGTQVAISGITVTNFSGGAADVLIDTSLASSSSSCGSGVSNATRIIHVAGVGAGETTHISYAHPAIAKRGEASGFWCIKALISNAPSSPDVEVYVAGTTL